MDNEIIKVDAISTVVRPAQESYTQNQLSRNNCISVGESLLQRVKTDGMTDELDREIADYIDKTRRTVRLMNERRSPITKMFDEIRTQFTSLEADLDVNSKLSVPHALQMARNMFAKQKHEAEEQRRQQELRRQQEAEERRKRNEACVTNFLMGLRWTIDNAIKELHATFNSLTLSNEEEVCKELEESAAVDGQMLEISLQNMQRFTDINSLRQKVNGYLDWYDKTRNDLISHIPTRLQELRDIANADAEQATRLAEEQRKQDELRRQQLEEQRKQADADAERQRLLQQKEAELQASFDAVSIEQQYKPKHSVTKRIELDDVSAIPRLFAFWWSREGCSLSLEDLRKQFKKQITFAEKAANKEELFIEDNSIRYVDEVKAK